MHSEKPCFHSKTKHIEIRHHFIRDSNKKKLIQMIKIDTNQNVADFLTNNVVRIIHKGMVDMQSNCCRVEIEVNMIHAKVEGKTIVISESSVKIDLQFDDEDEPITVPLSSQPKKTYRPRKFKRATEISQSSGPIPLVADEAVTMEREDRMERAATTASSLEARAGLWKLKELMDLYTKLSDRVLDLETTKTAQAKEIASLKKRVKKLERKRKSNTPRMNLFKIGSSIFEESDFDDEGFDADMDEVFKDVKRDAEQVISDAADKVSTADTVNTVGTKVNTASAPVTIAGVSVSTAKPITTASVNITTAEPITHLTTTRTIFEDEDLIITQTLVKMRSEKSKVRGVVMQEPSETATRPTVPPQQHDPKDKGKGKMVKQEKPLKKKDQIKFNEEISKTLQAQMQDELEEEERLAREREEDANIVEWDNAQAMMDADYKLAARLQAQEQEELTIEEKSRLFVELMDKRKKHFARLRAEEQRRKPLTKAQKRNQMYSFVSMDYEAMKGSKDRAEGSETRAEGSSKRAGEDLQQESTKKQKMDDDKEKEELKQCFEIVLDDEDDVTINVTPLSVKILIVDYKIYQEGKKMQSIPYYLLVEKMYPLTKHTLHQMFNDVKLQVDYECEMAYDLLRLDKRLLKLLKITAAGYDLRMLVVDWGKEIVENVVHTPFATTIARGMFKLNLEPLPPRLLQNREVHIDYLRNTQEQANILREIVEQAKVKQPLDSELDLSCKYATRIQELLVYVQNMCLNAITPSAKKVTVKPMNNVKKVRFAEPLTSSSKIQQVKSSNTSDSNTPVLSSTRVKCSTSNCGSKPPGNKKNDMISQTPSRNKKNKVEAQPRKVNKVNRVVKPVCLVDVKHSLSKANSEIFCATCNKSMFDGVHDKCLLDLVQNGNKRTKSSKKHKKQNIWKPTGHVFTEVGFKGKPTGRIFTIVGNSCPLTRKPKNVRNIGSSKIAKIVESKKANLSEPNQIWGSTTTDIPSSSSLVMTSCPDYSGMTRLQGLWGMVTISWEGLLSSSKRLLTQGVDLLSGSRDTNLYIISLDDMLKSSLICLLSKASKTKSYVWHRRLSHLNFACALGKSKKSSHQPKAKDTNQEKLYLLHMNLYGPMRVASINEKMYILVIVDDYSRFTWVRFLKTKDEAPAAIIKCIKNIQVHLKATVQNVRTDNGTEFINQTLGEWYENVGITHQTFVAHTLQQNGVVERQNRTLVEDARTMLIFSKAPYTACYTQNRSLIRLRYNKTPYELMQDKKLDLSFFHVFGSLCYHTNDNEDLGKFDAKADIGIFAGYAPAKKAFRIYNRRNPEIT
ncbi:retrovirus-related pol polyprotein from transposon TNT 1-94 [Tanacetum coccineum]